MKQLKYIDRRPIKMNLRNGGWISLPNEKTGNVITVTDAEASVLLKRKNGSLPCFEPLTKEPRARRQPEDVEHGNR